MSKIQEYMTEKDTIRIVNFLINSDKRFLTKFINIQKYLPPQTKKGKEKLG